MMLSRRAALIAAGSIGAGLAVPIGPLWSAETSPPSDTASVWRELERAIASGDPIALIRARLNVGIHYSVISSDLNDEDRVAAIKLLEANFDQRVASIDPGGAAMSRVIWARIMLYLQDRTTTRRMLSKIRAELLKAAELIPNSNPGAELMICIEAASAALIAEDYENARIWIEIANSRVDKQTANAQTEAGKYAELSQLTMLDAYLFAKNGEAENAAYLTELAIALSPTGKNSVAVAANKRGTYFVAELTAAASRFGAVVHLALTLAGAAIILSRIEGGKLRSTIHDLQGPSGSSLDSKDIEVLQWGDSLRNAYKKGFLGGWQGIYSAMDGQGGASSGATFRRGLPGMTERFWSVYVGQIVELLRLRGVQQGESVALILPTGLTQFPIRAACDPVTHITLNDLFAITEATDCVSLSHTHQLPTAGKRRLAGLFNPKGDLPGADAERQMVGAMFPLSGNNALPNNLSGPAFFASLARLKTDYLYFATHGSFGFIDDAGLLIGPRAKLTFDDIFTSRARLSARLAILSACETAVVSPLALGSHSQSLPNILLDRGVQGVVASLWKVNDDSTALLMHEMMRLHLTEGIEPPEALRRAQQWLASATGEHLVDHLVGIMDAHPTQDWALVADMAARLSNTDPATRPFAEPYYWGAFAFYGS